MWMATLFDTTKLTVELRELVESGIDIWAFDYPSYYEGDEKKTFEQKVIDHFYFRQIGQETTGRWLHMFRTRMKEIMPFYIQLYESQALMQSLDDPFGNVDITETFEQETDGQTSSEAKSESTNVIDTYNEHKYLDTPQGVIGNMDSYLTNASKDNNTETTDGTNKANATGTNKETIKHTLTRKGNQGVNTYAHDMKELRETFLNIDLMIINELNDLFIGVY